MIQIDWNATPVTLKFEVKDINGLPVASVHVPISELYAQSTNSKSAGKAEEHHRHCTLEANLPWIVRYRLTIFIFFTITGMLVLLMLAAIPVGCVGLKIWLLIKILRDIIHQKCFISAASYFIYLTVICCSFSVLLLVWVALSFAAIAAVRSCVNKSKRD